ncbi:hypothetical protein GUJ93_ZPchr0010g7991 [Zizania palustris]|uniref:Uncharacterized protein n=1 Tax=Zizania palustris TaxID=103762 RepID=A0A8J5WB61_ZIZPA|nr:hypothetical protein GUJ93_ZPchr0010g7991 [Zizania palustris]
MRTMAERGATTTTTTAPDYSIYDLAAAMASARERTRALGSGEEDNDEAAEKEVREIEFFPTSTSRSNDSEFATTASLTPKSSSAAGGSYGGGRRTVGPLSEAVEIDPAN